jgi:hypothetical protein
MSHGEQSSTPQKTDAGAADAAEIARLRGRIDQLEDELAALQAWANAVVADAQKQVYWLDRLHLDLDPIMRHVPLDFALGVYRKLTHRYYVWVLKPTDALRRLLRRLSP